MNTKINEIVGRFGVNKDKFHNKLLQWESEGIPEADLVYVSLLYVKGESLIDLSVNRSFKETVDFFEKNIEEKLIKNIKMRMVFYINKDVFLKDNEEYIIENKDYIILTSISDKYKKYFNDLYKDTNLYFFAKKSKSDFFQKKEVFIFNKVEETLFSIYEGKRYRFKSFFINPKFLEINICLTILYFLFLIPNFIYGFNMVFTCIATILFYFLFIVCNGSIYAEFKKNNGGVNKKIKLFKNLVNSD